MVTIPMNAAVGKIVKEKIMFIKGQNGKTNGIGRDLMNIKCCTGKPGV